MGCRMSKVLPVDRHQLDQLVQGEHGEPHAILGPHAHDGGVTVRVFKPLAAAVEIRYGDTAASLAHEHGGIWAGVLPIPEVVDYRVAVTYDGEPLVVDDPYRYLPTLGETDLHLINEGRHELLWTVLGAHVRHYAGGVTGTSFAVWAPAARGVRVKADFNNWDGREHPMRQLGQSGVWELFVPDVGSGTRYKFIILGADGEWREKADPMAYHTEVPPLTSSVVYQSGYSWGDGGWMSSRGNELPTARPMSVYEMHLGSWRKRGGQSLNYGQLADELVPTLGALGFLRAALLADGLLGLFGSLAAGLLLGGLLLKNCSSSGAELVGEALDASTGVDELLLAREERVALVAQFDMQLSAGSRTGFVAVSARADHGRQHVIRMDLGLHVISPLDGVLVSDQDSEDSRKRIARVRTRRHIRFECKEARRIELDPKS